METMAKGENRFESDASQYAEYLETPEGRLRTDLAFASLLESLPASAADNSLRAIDVGCGTGGAAVRLARLGIHVTLLDSSAAMLELANQTVAKAGTLDMVTLKQGDAAHLMDTIPMGSFDIILCHNLLEYVEDPGRVLQGIARLMRSPSAILSILVRNQSGEVLKAALQNGDLAAAKQNLTAKWGQESLYGGRVRLFTSEVLESILKDASLIVKARRGVRVIADYLPVQISRSAEYERIFALEQLLGKRQDCFGVARYIHFLASRAAA